MNPIIPADKGMHLVGGAILFGMFWALMPLEYAFFSVMAVGILKEVYDMFILKTGAGILESLLDILATVWFGGWIWIIVHLKDIGVLPMVFFT